MSQEVQLLRCLKKREVHSKIAKYVKEYTLYPETAQLVTDIGEYYKYHPEKDTIDWSEFQTWFRINKHPTWKADQHKVFASIIDNVAKSDDTDTSVVARFIELDYATQIHEAVQKVFTGAGTDGLDKVEDIIAARSSSRELPDDSAFMVKIDAPELFRSMWSATGGIRWRLEDLNKSIGPLHRGDLILIGKRPEVGGTTFVTSELTHMVTQLPEGKHAIIFNNEEIGPKVGVRLLQSALDMTVYDIMADPKKAQESYDVGLGGHRIDVYHDTSISVSDIDRVSRSGVYGLIAINILDKVAGFKGFEGVERLRALAQWSRKLADKHGVVFVVAQADASAEGQRYLDQSQLYGSKTGMQADSDVQLMIGKDNNPGFENTRWISVVRNKTLGDAGTDPALRHGKFEVEFDGERARFRSRTWPT
jgi:Replicative DNA helicase